MVFDVNTATARELARNTHIGSYRVFSPSTLMKSLSDCQGPAVARIHEIRSGRRAIAPTVGNYAHENLQTGVNRWIETQQRPSKAEVEEIVDMHLKEDRKIELVDEIDNEEKLIEAEKSIREFSIAALTQVLDTVNDPQYSEVQLYYTHETDRYAHEVTAIIDLVDVDPETNEVRVRDLKTSATFSPDRYLKSPQMPIYTAAMTANGMPTKTARIDHLRRLKSGVKYREITMIRGEEHWQHVGVLLDQFEDAKMEGLFTFNPNSWMCNEGCPLWDRCEFRYPDEPAQGA